MNLDYFKGIILCTLFLLIFPATISAQDVVDENRHEQWECILEDPASI